MAKRPRHTFECILSSPEEKETLQERIERVRTKLSPARGKVDNASLINAMLDALEEKLASMPDDTPTCDETSLKPFLRDIGECSLYVYC